MTTQPPDRLFRPVSPAAQAKGERMFCAAVALLLVLSEVFSSNIQNTLPTFSHVCRIALTVTAAVLLVAKSLLLTQWPSLVSFALYVWQFHFVSSEARSFLLAGLGQYPGLPLFSLACRLVIPFSNHSWGPPETLAANALSLLMLAVLFSLGFLWGRRRR